VRWQAAAVQRCIVNFLNGSERKNIKGVTRDRLLAIVLFALASRLSAEVTSISVLIDSDNNPATGCRVIAPVSNVDGVDAIVTTNYDAGFVTSVIGSIASSSRRSHRRRSSIGRVGSGILTRRRPRRNAHADERHRATDIRRTARRQPRGRAGHAVPLPPDQISIATARSPPLRPERSCSMAMSRIGKASTRSYPIR